MPADASEVRHNEAACRYELLVDYRIVGVAEYVDNGDRRTFTYTEIDRDRRGHGLGRHLVEVAVEDTRARGLTAVPQCSFVQAVMRPHLHALPSSRVQGGDGPACPIPPATTS